MKEKEWLAPIWDKLIVVRNGSFLGVSSSLRHCYLWGCLTVFVIPGADMTAVYWFEQSGQRGECFFSLRAVTHVSPFSTLRSAPALPSHSCFVSTRLRTWRTFKLLVLCIGAIFWIVIVPVLTIFFFPFFLNLIPSFLSFRDSSKFLVCLWYYLSSCTALDLLF